MVPYYQDDAGCECGCSKSVASGKRFISGHNLVNLPKSAAHRKGISEGQRKAWQTKRARLPLGSKNKDVHGYVRIKVVPGAGRWEKEHVLVIESCLNRKLLPGETVHHINGVRDDNRIENLYLCKTISEHSALEHSMKSIVRELLDEGLVRFNQASGRYERIL